MNSRRALFRWVLRVVRFEWRQHALVVAMIAFGITIATLLVTSAVRFEEPRERLSETPASVEFQVLSEEAADSGAFEAELLAVRSAFPDTEIQVSERRSIQGPTLIGGDPTAPLGSVNFEPLEGRRPGEGEVALTERAIDQLTVFFGEQVKLGETREIGAGSWTIVGIWENPNNLDRSAALVPVDQVGVWASARALLPTSFGDSIIACTAIGTATENGEDPSVKFATSVAGTDLPGSEPSSGAMLAYLAGTVLCVQIAVLAPAGFTVLASRRTRQFAISLGLPKRGVLCQCLGGAEFV